MPAESKTRPKVVIDTNVFVSGLTFKGKPRRVLDLIWKGEIEVCVSSFILKELKETLEKDFAWEGERIEETIERIKRETLQVQPKTKISVIKEKESDNRILECGVEGKAQYIISGDKRHLLPLKEYQGIKIISPAQFLRIISQEASSGGF
ncbi:putative toxin-antitoxin system toxin component, PIN family [Candidatus Aerophobetes bacterium]|nr:putative toxin-antitoxin system toxin component, PIN family [Candidatus Aerophobetes bacterium]